MTSLLMLIGVFLNGPLNLFACFVFRTRLVVIAQFYWWPHLSLVALGSVLRFSWLFPCMFLSCAQSPSVDGSRRGPESDQTELFVFIGGVYLSVHMLVCVCRSRHLWRTDSWAERVLLASCLCTHRPPFPTSPWACQPPAPPA